MDHQKDSGDYVVGGIASFVSTTWSAERAIRVLAYEPFRPIT